jgi:hypothetical protein
MALTGATLLGNEFCETVKFSLFEFQLFSMSECVLQLNNANLYTLPLFWHSSCPVPHLAVTLIFGHGSTPSFGRGALILAQQQGHVAEMRRRGMHIGYWWERDHWDNQGIGGWKILKWILERECGMVWTGLVEISGGLLRTR